MARKTKRKRQEKKENIFRLWKKWWVAGGFGEWWGGVGRERSNFTQD